jgi:hypothetical protein
VQVQITPILTGDPAAAAEAVAPLPEELLGAPLDDELLDEQAAMISAADRAARARATAPAFALPADGLPSMGFIMAVRSSVDIFDVDVIC